MPPATVDLDDGFHEGYRLRRERHGWSVFVRERGVEHAAIGFPSEEDAPAYLCERLVPERATRARTSGSYLNERLSLIRTRIDPRKFTLSHLGFCTRKEHTMNPRRLRDYGITIGSMPPGHRNDITDVPGVSVGHTTIDTDRHKTGVTVILPSLQNTYTQKLTAAAHVINGYGKTAGLMQIRELGTLETPIVLTGTLNVGKMCDALVGYTVERCAGEGQACRSVNPVVGETNDGTLSAGMDRPAGEDHLRAAIAEAERLWRSETEAFAQGDVGAGKGTVCHGLKGGIGSASRVMDLGGRRYTLGVLVQTNYGCIEDLRLDGLPVGRAVLDMIAEETRAANSRRSEKALCDNANETVSNPIEGQDDIGSIMIIVATDLPLSELQLGRILRRATVGLARMGSHIGHGSGDVVIGFTTARHQSEGDIPVRSVKVLRDDLIELPFRAIAECTEEAIANSLVAADRVTGFDGENHVTVRALSEFLPEAIVRARRMAAAGTAH